MREWSITIQYLLEGLLSWVSSGTKSGKEPLSSSCEITREFLFNNVFFWILQAFVCSLPVELYDNSCQGSEKVQLKNSRKFHTDEVESFSWRTLLYFMSTKWKSFTGEIYYIPWPRIGKVLLERSAMLHIHQVEKFTWGTLR